MVSSVDVIVIIHWGRTINRSSRRAHENGSANMEVLMTDKNDLPQYCHSRKVRIMWC